MAGTDTQITAPAQIQRYYIGIFIPSEAVAGFAYSTYAHTDSLKVVKRVFSVERRTLRKEGITAVISLVEIDRVNESNTKVHRSVLIRPGHDDIELIDDGS